MGDSINDAAIIGVAVGIAGGKNSGVTRSGVRAATPKPRVEAVSMMDRIAVPTAGGGACAYGYHLAEGCAEEVRLAGISAGDKRLIAVHAELGIDNLA